MTSHEQQIISTICPAIQSRRLIRIWYKNNTSGLTDWRTVEPYLIGAYPRKHIQLSAWFVPTEDQQLVGQKEGWRTYLLKNISEVEVQEATFEASRPDYDPLGNGMKEIFCSAEKQVQAFMKISR